MTLAQEQGQQGPTKQPLAAGYPVEPANRGSERLLCQLKPSRTALKPQDLQDSLGRLNDIATHHELIGGGAQADVGATSGDEVEALLHKSQRAFERFAATNPFWKAT
jgi:hypothetical protein